MAEKVKYQFNGQTYTIKGRLCHDIVKYYVEQNPNATLATLQKAFNTATHMIVATPEMALTVVNSDGKAGGDYYMKEADQISIKKGKVVVWSYWPESYFKPFMEQVKALGLDVVAQECEKKVDAKAPVPTSQQPNSPVVEILNEIKEKMENNGLDRLSIYANDCCPEDMDWDEFENKYADELDGLSNYSIEYSDIEEGYSWQNILLRTIKLEKDTLLFDFQTVIGNNDEDPSEELDYDEDKTINDLLGYDEDMVLQALKNVVYNIDTLMMIQKDINNQKETVSLGTKKLNLFIGGNDAYYFYVKDYGSWEDLEALKAKEDDFHSEISEFFDSLNDCVVKYNVVTKEDDLKVSVKDKSGKVVFEERIDECNPFEGDFENWVFSDDVEQEVINALKGYIEEKKQDDSFDEDEFIYDAMEYFGPRFDVERVCELNGYSGKKWFVSKWGKLEPMADDDETERAEYEAPFGHSYGVGYCGEIEIPENEDFDIEKLQFLVDDYLGLLPDDDCIDSVLPYVKYGNKIFKLHLKNSYWRSEKYGLVRLNPTYGSLSFKDYEEFLNE